MYIHTHTHTHTNKYIKTKHALANAHEHAYTHTHAHANAHVHVHAHAHAHMHTQTPTQQNKYTHTHICMTTYTHAHTHKHTHAHASASNTHSSLCSCVCVRVCVCGRLRIPWLAPELLVLAEPMHSGDFRKKTCFDAGKIRFCHSAAVLQTQVPKFYTELDLSPLYILISGTHSKFARKINFLALGVCFSQPCSSAVHRFATLRSRLQNYRRIVLCPQQKIR